MTFATAFAVMSFALAFYVAAMNHRFARAPGWGDQRWFSAVALTIGGYSAANLPIALARSDALVLHASRAQIAFAVLHCAAWLLYSRAQVRPRDGGWERAVAAAYAIAAVVALVPGAVYDAPLRRTEYVPWHVTYAIPRLTTFGSMLLLACLLLLASVAVRYGLAWWRRAPYAGVHFASFGVFFALCANDVLVALEVCSGPYLIDLALLLPIGAVAFSLTSRFADDARALAALRQRLEAAVEERTRELTAAQDALHQAEKLASLGQFSTGVAHEINNPSSVVSANLKYLESAVRGGALPPDAGETIRESICAVDRIAGIVRQLLDAGRRAAKKVSLEPVSVADCAREAAAIARVRVPEHVDVSLAVDEGLFALGEAGPLVQVLQNLLVNGAEAIPHGQAGHVVVRAERTALGRVRVVVEDDGAGMPDEVRRRVFEPFFSTKPQGLGTGLGLAVSHGLVASLGGRLELDSSPGRGTRAILELGEASPRAPAPRVIPSAAPRGRRRQMLLVDDDRAVLRALTRILEPHYFIHPAESVDEALALADLRRPDVLVADVVMPDGGGPTMYRTLQAQHPDLASRVIFITGGAAKEPVRHFLASQPQPVIEKPIDLDVLARIVERLAPDGAGASRPSRRLN